MPEAPRLRGQVVAAHGRHYSVQVETEALARHCYARGKKSDAAVGDQVLVQAQGEREGVITQILPRRNLLYRADAARSKRFAANLDQLLLVLAPEPEFSDDLTGRALVAAASADVPALIVLNKADLPTVHQAQARLQTLESLGIPRVTLSALDGDQVRTRLLPHLQDRTSLLLGQSGMGKSTLLNTLVPDALAATRSHSTSLGTGRHTTTFTRLYRLPGGGSLIDSPGFQTFGLQHLSLHEIEHGFPEFAPAIAACRFYNCTHRREPGCGVLAAVAEGRIAAQRHALYVRILAENDAAKKW